MKVSEKFGSGEWIWGLVTRVCSPQRRHSAGNACSERRCTTLLTNVIVWVRLPLPRPETPCFVVTGLTLLTPTSSTRWRGSLCTTRLVRPLLRCHSRAPCALRYPFIFRRSALPSVLIGPTALVSGAWWRAAVGAVPQLHQRQQ